MPKNDTQDIPKLSIAVKDRVAIKSYLPQISNSINAPELPVEIWGLIGRYMYADEIVNFVRCVYAAPIFANEMFRHTRKNAEEVVYKESSMEAVDDMGYYTSISFLTIKESEDYGIVNLQKFIAQLANKGEPISDNDYFGPLIQNIRATKLLWHAPKEQTKKAWEFVLEAIKKDNLYLEGYREGLKGYLSGGLFLTLMLRTFSDATLEAQPIIKEVLTLLVQKGVDPNAENNDGYTALHFKFYYDSLWLTEFLVKEIGCNINANNTHNITKITPTIPNSDKIIYKTSGWTPLHFACLNVKSNSVDTTLVVNKLLDLGANPLIENSDKQTSYNIISANARPYCENFANILKHMDEVIETNNWKIVSYLQPVEEAQFVGEGSSEEIGAEL